ncbi:hypothetical protein [Micromonospora mirobrigensis]|uniref:Uncharacterized protein n=1 Tax=Micromonospora mirobrigensis TaxID=262898 RepID=A0A1C4UMP4_9ACTN|nr:hypothetical protein GA0070564_101597 [Micromonospora mirobrigensis]
MSADDPGVVDAVTQRVRAVRSGVNRISMLPLLVRFLVFLAAFASFLLAFPGELLVGRGLLALLVAAVLPALGPRRVWPTFAVLVAVGGWLLATAGYGQRPELWRLLGLATTLYLTHSLCALAALLPYDGVVDPTVLVRWVTRAGAVVLAGAVLGVLLMEAGGLGPGGGFRTATVAGLLVAVGLAALLGWLLRRR